MPRECLPPHLQDQPHIDWPKPFDKVSRNETSFCGDPPTLLGGTTIKPIPLPGEWTYQRANLAPGTPIWVPRYYYAYTTAAGVHFRAGTRWNDGIGDAPEGWSGYYSYPSFTVKKPYGDPPFDLPETS